VIVDVQRQLVAQPAIKLRIFGSTMIIVLAVVVALQITILLRLAVGMLANLVIQTVLHVRVVQIHNVQHVVMLHIN
jgi:hypothetical protein